MKETDLIQHLLDVVSQQHSDIFTIVEVFIAIISLGAIFTGILQWRLSDKQIEKMKERFKEDYGIDNLQKQIKEGNELNKQLRENLVDNVRVEINTTGSILPMTQLIDVAGIRGNIVGNFTAALRGAYNSEAFEDDILGVAIALVDNYMWIFINGDNKYEPSYIELRNLNVGVEIIEAQLNKSPFNPDDVTDFVNRKDKFYTQFNVKEILENNTPTDNPMTRDQRNSSDDK